MSRLEPSFEQFAREAKPGTVIPLVRELLADALSPVVTYATVADEGYLDQYAGRRNEHRFEVVGYGLRREHPKFEEEGDTRMRAEPKLDNLTSNPKNTYMVLSNNPSTGGTCFGDSGGPTFDEAGSLLLVAVTSFGNSPNCTGNGGAYRLDQPDDLGFLADHGITP